MSINTLINIAFVVIITWFLYSRFRPIKGLKNLKPYEFQSEFQTGKNVFLVDVREPSEFQGGYIPGARNIPLSQLNGRISEIPKDKRLMLYCRSGMKSKTAARLLLKSGFKNLAHLQGGIGAWQGNISK
ncbi:sulfurtransferase [Cohnella kolymensis]|uniref:Sulfurtransferase n=1 Tax=Cohnella kolymensis TaxID=1590652 RepID=A0ABR5A8I8_9BACL|nr:rhodanese-like domain-containing protein [Cohnella kolymensis]KIL37379.1 sulfurtransferase [Cohnella kolymensis]